MVNPISEDPGARVETLRERIKNNGKDGAISDADKDVLLTFSDELYLRKTQYY